MNRQTIVVITKAHCESGHELNTLITVPGARFRMPLVARLWQAQEIVPCELCEAPTRSEWRRAEGWERVKYRAELKAMGRWPV